MSIVKIAESTPVPKPVPVFGTAKDLAHGFIREWVDANKDLRKDCDKAFLFIKEVLDSPPRERNRLEQYLFQRQLTKHRRRLKEMVQDLRHIVTEIESLIGHSAYLREGLKMKIKNKKQFDDVLVEYREITIMLLGLANLIAYGIRDASNYIVERDILTQLQSESKSEGYYQNLYGKIGLFDFK